MPHYSTKKPIYADTRDYNRYLEAGICLQKSEGRANFHEVLILKDFLSPERLATLSEYDLTDIDDSIVYGDDLTLQKQIREGIRLSAFAGMLDTPADGYPIRGESPFFTWEMNETIVNEVDQLSQKLASHGVETKIGLEIEFCVPDKPLNGFRKAEDLKQEILQSLRQDILTTNGDLADLVHEIDNFPATPDWMDVGPEAADKHEQNKDLLKEKIILVADPVLASKLSRLLDIREFKAREIMMLDLLERDSRTREILEPLFGTSGDGKGYYDAEGVLELKLKPDSPRNFTQNWKQVVAAIYEKSLEYGLKIKQPPNYHESFSFWKNGQNLMDSQSEAHLIVGKEILENVAFTCYECLPAFVSQEFLSQSGQNQKLGISLNRETVLIRNSNGRFEIRPMQEEEQMNPDLYCAIVMAGALAAMEHAHDKEKFSQAKVVQNPNVRFTNDRYKLLAHLLSGSILREDGSLEIPQQYARENNEGIQLALGIRNRLSQGLAKIFSKHTPEYWPEVEAFLEGIKISGSEIMFPTNTVDRKYIIESKAKDADGYPPEMRERLDNGESPNFIGGLSDYMREHNLPWPKMGYKYVIDPEKLKRNLEITVTDKLVVEGYDLDKTELHPETQQEMSVKESRMFRFKNSKTLNAVVSEAFKDRLLACSNAHFIGEKRDKIETEVTLQLNKNSLQIPSTQESHPAATDGFRVKQRRQRLP